VDRVRKEFRENISVLRNFLQSSIRQDSDVTALKAYKSNMKCQL